MIGYPGDTPNAKVIGKQCPMTSAQLKSEFEEAERRRLPGEPQVVRPANPDCRDVNPGTFHLVLTEFLGNLDPSRRRPFVMDRAIDTQKWNYPVVGFSTSGSGSGPRPANLASGNLKENSDCKRSIEQAKDRGHEFFIGDVGSGVDCIVSIEVAVTLVNYAAPDRSSVAGRKTLAPITFAYWLELDNDGYIVGGEWNFKKMQGGTFQGSHPDAIWLPQGDRYKASTADNQQDVSYVQLKNIFQ